MNCPSCLSRVSRGARMCAVCGDSLAEETLLSASQVPIPTVVVPRRLAAEALAPASSGNGNGHRTADFGSPLALAFGDAPAEPEARAAHSFCDLCGEGLEPEARFCSFCGTSVADEAPSPVAGPEETLVRAARVSPTTAAGEGPAPAVETPVAGSAPAGAPTVLRFEPRRPSESAPAPRRAPEPAPAGGGESWLDRKFDLRSAALVLAALALAAAFVVHLVGPSGPAGMTEGELEMTQHLRAAEWLLGGILVALMGLLARR